MIRLFELAPTFDIDVTGRPPVLPARLEAEVERVWAEQQRQRTERLFNGRLFTLVRHSRYRLEVAPLEYRHLIAARQVPELARLLKLRPVAVTGITGCPEGIVLGRRGPHMATDPGRWELAPAGGLAMPDAARQVLEELEEEIGLVPDQVERPVALGLTEDPCSGIHEVLFRIETRMPAAEILACHRTAGSDEYDTLEVVPRDGFAAFLERCGGATVPGFEAFLRFAGLL